VTAVEIAKKKTLISREKNEELISRNCLPYHKRASTFINTHKAARLHLLPTLSRYYGMSESMQRNHQRSSFHNFKSFRYDEQRPALHAEGLKGKTVCKRKETRKSTLGSNPALRLQATVDYTHILQQTGYSVIKLRKIFLKHQAQ
jgi:hypothetical protein